MTNETPTITIPSEMLPKDGRFGSGPSKVRAEAIGQLAESGVAFLGTSHRKAPVKKMVERLQNGLRELFDLPDDYEVLLGNGGTTVLWDAMCFGLIKERSQHLSFGEFSSKFAKAAATTPFLKEPSVIKSEPGSAPRPETDETIDFYALTHNETSTGVATKIERPAASSGLVAVDATSAVVGQPVNASEFDFYYFAPQKGLASDGGLWLALASPQAIERIEEIHNDNRWIPASIDLSIAVENSRLNQTYNTPALATIFLATQQVEWILQNGGLDWSVEKCRRSSELLYNWAEKSSYLQPFVQNPEDRSSVTVVLDVDDSIPADNIIAALRSNGIVDTDGYRKLGRNQLRVATFPSIEIDDIEALTHSVDFVVDKLN